MYGLDLARTDVEAVMTVVVMCAGWCLLGIYQYTNQFCRIGKDCGRNGDRLSKKNESMPYLH